MYRIIVNHNWAVYVAGYVPHVSMFHCSNDSIFVFNVRQVYLDGVDTRWPVWCIVFGVGDKRVAVGFTSQIASLICHTAHDSATGLFVIEVPMLWVTGISGIAAKLDFWRSFSNWIKELNLGWLTFRHQLFTFTLNFTKDLLFYSFTWFFKKDIISIKLNKFILSYILLI